MTDVTPARSGDTPPFALSIPASAEHFHLLRLIVAGVLGNAGFTIEEIEDVKLAVEELANALCAPPGRPDLVVTIQLAESAALITGRRDVEVAPEPVSDFAETILEAVVDSYSFTHEGPALTFSLSKLSRA